MTTRSASIASAVDSKPACSRSPAIRSESWTFIWQPNVSIRYLRATELCPRSFCVPRALCVLCALPDFRFRPFAFACPGPPRGGTPPFRPSLKHLTRRAPKAIGDRVPAEHPRDLVDAAAGIEAPDGRPRPPALDTLVDFEVRIGVGRNLWQMRDAQHLKRRCERPQPPPDHA